MIQYVLIIMLSGNSIATAEFENKATCEAALEQAQEKLGYFPRVIEGVCVPKWNGTK